MPELPELEALRESLARSLGGRLVTAASCRQPNLLKTYKPPLSSLVGQRLTEVERRGKHVSLLFDSGPGMLVHLMRGGRLVLTEGNGKGNRYLSLTLAFEGPFELRLLELGSKKRSAVYLLTESELEKQLAFYGPEPLSPGFTPEILADRLKSGAGQIKTWLMDQANVAGIGNAYSDEILYQARLAPTRNASSLSQGEVAALHSSMVAVLAEGLERSRQDNYVATPRLEKRPWMAVHGRSGAFCPRCSEIIREIRFAERSTFYCPECQTGGRILADRGLSRLLKGSWPPASLRA